MGGWGVLCDYYLGGQNLEAVEQECELGVLISNDLKIAEQCQEAYAKANKMLGLVNRAIKYSDKVLMFRLY